jgi:hypothetical protein
MNKSNTIDILTLNHMILWAIIGYFYPNNYYLALFIGILWELFERYIVYNKQLYNFVKKYWFVPEKYWNEININSFIDIIVNMIGYYIGSNMKKWF